MTAAEGAVFDIGAHIGRNQRIDRLPGRTGSEPGTFRRIHHPRAHGVSDLGEPADPSEIVPHRHPISIIYIPGRGIVRVYFQSFLAV